MPFKRQFRVQRKPSVSEANMDWDNSTLGTVLGGEELPEPKASDILADAQIFRTPKVRFGQPIISLHTTPQPDPEE